MFSIESLRTDSFSWGTAASLAEASKLAYEKQSILEEITLGKWGFHRSIALDRGDTQGFIAVSHDLILIAFRGSESIGDWLGNLDVLPTQRSYSGRDVRLHRGFLNAYLLVEQQVQGAVDAVRHNNPRLWLTGHSLGGALATIAAAELQHKLVATGICTFGQPRLDGGGMRELFSEHFRERFMRFVNDDDIVTQVPPGYTHVGKLVHFDARGNVQKPELESLAGAIEPPPLSDAEYSQLQSTINKAKAELRLNSGEGGLESIPQREIVLDATLEGFIPGLSDHKLELYITNIKRQLDTAGASRLRGLEAFESTRGQGRLERAGGSEGPGPVADKVPVLVKLRDAEQWSAPADLKIDSRFGRFVSASSSAESLERLRSDPNVEGIEVSRDAGVLELASSVPFVNGSVVHRPPISERGDAALVGIIDSGIDVLHETFLDGNGKTRILAVWNQLDDAGPSPNAVDPAHFGQTYGRLYLQAEIRRFIDQTNPTPPALRDPRQHGTHVSSIAAGRAVGGLADGMAPEAGLVVVIPKMTTAQDDPRSIGYSKSHFDALAFLKVVSQGGSAVCQARKPMAVNVSLGMNAGAHDGTSYLESGFDSITMRGRDEGFVVVKSAGNERGFGGHARSVLGLGINHIQWQSKPIFRSTDYFELWYDGLDEVEFTLVDPAGRRSATASRTGPVVQQCLGNNRCLLKLKENHEDNGDNLLQLIISEDGALIQEGTWTLELQCNAIRSRNAQADIWIERDDSSRAVRFVPEESEATISIPGTADTVITVAACRVGMPLSPLAQSSFGPTRKGGAKPDVCAPGHEILAALASDPDHRASTAMSGTSMAAPHVTGALALALSHRAKVPSKRQHNARQLRSALNFTARPPGSHHRATGHGVLDAEALFNRLK